jgi:hypothetical protein
VRLRSPDSRARDREGGEGARNTFDAGGSFTRSAARECIERAKHALRAKHAVKARACAPGARPRRMRRMRLLLPCEQPETTVK